MLGFCSSENFIRHDTGPHHPERPDRIRAIHRAVREAGLIDSPDPFPDFRIDLGINPAGGEKLKELEFSAADEGSLSLVHTQKHVDFVRHVCSSGGGVLDDSDTPVGKESYDIAMLSLGAVLRAADAVAAGEVKRCFSASRPPGHHAEPDTPMGFCLFSNVAIAARHLQKKHGVGKIAIVDFDVHHGNGTQAAFESDSSVCFISIHQHPHTCYPGTGHDWEIGIGDARGYTLNVPMSPGSGDDDYYAAFDNQILPKLDWFKPELLIISAGFDAHAGDPLAEINLSDDAYEQMTRRLVQAADTHCAGKIVSALEGGYNLKSLGRSVVRHLLAMR